MPEGTAEIWHQRTGPSGVAGWQGKLTAGKTIETFLANDKQHAADQATGFWPNVVRREQARVAKIEASAQLERQIDDAYAAGRVDVMSFGLGASDYDRLIEINVFLRHKHMLDGPLKPLAEAVSAELYRRLIG
jgi:hypothetical protein